MNHGFAGGPGVAARQRRGDARVALRRLQLRAPASGPAGIQRAVSPGGFTRPARQPVPVPAVRRDDGREVGWRRLCPFPKVAPAPLPETAKQFRPLPQGEGSGDSFCHRVAIRRPTIARAVGPACERMNPTLPSREGQTAGGGLGRGARAAAISEIVAHTPSRFDMTSVLAKRSTRWLVLPASGSARSPQEYSRRGRGDRHPIRQSTAAPDRRNRRYKDRRVLAVGSACDRVRVA